MPVKVKEFYKRYENHISSLALITGFIFDNLTLRRADLLAENLILVAYILIVAISILVLNAAESNEYRFISEVEVPSQKMRAFPFNIIVYILKKIHFFSSAIIQFCFGGLFSAFLVFYSRSSTFEASWPFLFLIVLMLLANEIFKRQYIRLTVQVSVLFLCLFSFNIFFIPLIFHKISSGVFILSGLVSLFMMYLFLRLVMVYNRDIVFKSFKPIIASILFIFIAVNILYFTNSIPPLPLVMKKGGVYHSVQTTLSGDYVAIEEEKKWNDLFRTTSLFHRSFGDPVYIVTAVYSPVDLNTDIVHNWQFYDEYKKEWISTNKIKVPIIGGREGGYRLYSLKNNIFEGLWRVDVETVTGQIMGRIKFRIIDSDILPEMNEVYYL